MHWQGHFHARPDHEPLTGPSVANIVQILLSIGNMRAGRHGMNVSVDLVWQCDYQSGLAQSSLQPCIFDPNENSYKRASSALHFFD